MGYYVIPVADLPPLIDEADVKAAIVDEARRSGVSGGTLVVIPAAQAQAVSFTVTTPPPQVTITDTRAVEDAR